MRKVFVSLLTAIFICYSSISTAHAYVQTPVSLFETNLEKSHIGVSEPVDENYFRDKLSIELQKEIDFRYDRTLGIFNYLVEWYGISLSILTGFPFVIALLVIIFRGSILNYLNRESVQRITELEAKVKETEKKLVEKSLILNKVTSTVIIRQILDLLPDLNWSKYHKNSESLYIDLQDKTILLLKQFSILELNIDGKDINFPSDIDSLIDLVLDEEDIFFLRSIDFIKLGLIQMYAKKFEKSVKLFEMAISLSPYTQYRAHYWNGIAYDELKKYDKAINCFRRSLDIDARNSSSWRGLAWVYYEKGEYEESIKYLDISKKINPSNPMTLINLGNSYFKKGKLPDAISYYEEAANLDPKLFLSQYNLACVYADSDPDKALEFLEKAIDLNPLAAKMASTDPDFSTIRDNYRKKLSQLKYMDQHLDM